MTFAPPDPETLLAEQAWLRRLAGSLVRDDGAADDLVQETWLTALRRPRQREGSLRGWLATLLRNKARDRAREERRRSRRQRVVAAEAAVEDQVESTLGLQEEVVGVLRGLAEPYRTALFLRYYRDLSPTEIAEQQSVSLETVRSRLRRGLAMIRAELDQRRDGRRALWLAPLGIFAEGRVEATAAASAAGALGGVLVMKKLVIVAASVVVLAGGWVAWSELRGLLGVGESQDGPEVELPTVAVGEPAPSATAETGRFDSPGASDRRAVALPDANPAAETKASDVGAVTVFLDDANGARTQRWSLYLDAEDGPGPNPMVLPSEESSASFTDVPPGYYTLSGSSPLGGNLGKTSVVVEAGKISELRLRYDGPRLDRRLRIRVQPRLRPLPGIEIPPEALRVCRSGDTIPRAATEPYIYDDLEPGEYTVELSDPRFEPLRVEGARPGELVKLRPVGSAAVQLEVYGGVRGERLTDYALELECTTVWSSKGNRWSLRAAGHPVPAGEVYGGLLPDELDPEWEEIVERAPMPLTLIVTAEGYPSLRIPLRDLRSGETRRVLATLRAGLAIGGHVVHLADDSPFAGVELELTRGPQAGHDLGPTGSISRGGGEIPRRDRATITDASGAFRFDDLSPGEYTVRARISRWIVLDRTVNLSLADLTDLRFEASAECWLFGRLRFPEEGVPEELELELHVNQPNPRGEWRPSRRESDGGLEADGTYRVGPLRAGRVELSLCVGTAGSTTCSWGDWEAVLIAGEETRLDLDVSHCLPAHFLATIEVEGEPDARCLLSIKGSSDGQRYEVHPVHCSPPLSGCEGVLAAGEWRLAAQSSKRDWAWASPEPLRLQHGERRELNLVLRRSPGTLRFIDETSGTPLAGCVIHWGLVGIEAPRDLFGSRPLAPLRTDEQGEVTLRLPPSEFHFRLAGTPASTAVRLRWSELGPDRSEVVLKE